MRTLNFLLSLILGALPLMAQITVTDCRIKNGIKLDECVILLDSTDAPIVETAARLFADDVNRVTGKQLHIVHFPGKLTPVIAGTLDSHFVRELIKRQKIDVSDIKNKRECFIIATIDNPFAKCSKGLVVIGSDPRGTAYGLLTLSEKIGVSPWYWWADVPVRQRETIYLSGSYISTSPSIRYRGIFLNDEDWGLKPWAAKTYEPETGNIGPKTYARICELILRLKGNMLAPAMHGCSTPFYCIPENKAVADSFGIMITTSHCEPLLFNNASKMEWDTAADGEWNYKTNRERIYSKLDNRVKEAAQYDNIYTLAMRGLHDEGMKGDMTISEKVDILAQAIADQRRIISSHVNSPLDSVPQIFVPYKEAQQLYENGLDVPNYVTLVWPDDNYGYLKMLSNPDERKRKGRSGVYYHVSYLGLPHDYLWLNTTAPMLMYEELKKAYDTGADRYWLLNVGDIKPMELAIQTFFDMAWNIDSFDYDNINNSQSEFLGSVFGREHIPQFQRILDSYYKLAWSRKPEFMGWEREWDAPELTGMKDAEFSFDNYDEAVTRLEEYKEISDRCDALICQLPEAARTSFFEMVSFPVMAANQMNRKFLMAKLNHELAERKEYAKANWAAEQSKLAYDSINSLMKQYNSLIDGKWNYMMDLPTGWVALYYKMPELIYFENVSSTPIHFNRSHKEDSDHYVVPLGKYDYCFCDDKHSIRKLNGIGYDWESIQLGEPLQPSSWIDGTNRLGVGYALPAINADSVTVTVYTVPRFPLYKGASTKFAVSVNNEEPVIFNDVLKEYLPTWKDQVLQNGKMSKATFKWQPDCSPASLNIYAIDPGLIVQRVIVDWRGLKQSYLGPSLK